MDRSFLDWKSRRIPLHLLKSSTCIMDYLIVKLQAQGLLFSTLLCKKIVK